ncbi:MAG: ATP-binding protein [Thermoanaerobaculia bacterium]|nr:ATP-binding protein [Thermoanaerobaculia bacterium]
MPRKVSALQTISRWLDDELRRHQVDERTAFRIQLAAEELFTNMVRHNVSLSAEEIVLEVEVSPERVRLVLIDHDVEPWNPASAPPVAVDAPAAEREPGGLGVHLLRNLMDGLEYAYEGGAMRVEAVVERAT